MEDRYRYRNEQKFAKESARRGWILWYVWQGTYRKDRTGPRGKAAKKAAKKLTHTKRYYLVRRLVR